MGLEVILFFNWLQSMAQQVTNVDGIIQMILIATAAWFIIAGICLARLRVASQANASLQPQPNPTPAQISGMVHLAWLAIPLLAVPSGLQMHRSHPDSFTGADGLPLEQRLPATGRSAEFVTTELVENPVPIAALKPTVHPI